MFGKTKTKNVETDRDCLSCLTYVQSSGTGNGSGALLSTLMSSLHHAEALAVMVASTNNRRDCCMFS